MVVLTNLASPTLSDDHLRPFDVRRDLTSVANLIEECFADTLDPDGKHYLRQMRSAADNPGYLRWAYAAAERVSLPLSGYVWEDEGQIVGNLTLIPFSSSTRFYFLVANVAVHPDYRRRGIARLLTAKAVEHARQRGAQATWLHVREENRGAIQLYRSLGFTERARRTTWYNEPPAGLLAVESTGQATAQAYEFTSPSVRVRPRQARHWPAQFAWLSRLYPPEVSWHLPINPWILRPDLAGKIYRFLTDARAHHWSAEDGSRLVGVLSLQQSTTFADNLWLAAAPENEGRAAYALLRHLRQTQPPRRPLSLDYPAGAAVEAIQAAGFYPHQTLIWMSVPLR